MVKASIKEIIKYQKIYKLLKVFIFIGIEKIRNM